MLFGKAVNGVVVTEVRVPDKIAEEIVLEGRIFKPALIRNEFDDFNIVYVSGDKYLKFSVFGEFVNIKVLDFPGNWTIVTNRSDFIREVLDNITAARKEFYERVNSYVYTRINWPDNVTYGPFKIKVVKWEDSFSGYHWKISVEVGGKMIYLNNYFTTDGRILFKKFKRDFPDVNVTKNDLMVVRKIVNTLGKSISDEIKKLKEELAHEIAEKYGVEVFPRDS